MTAPAADAYGEAFADVYDSWYVGVTDAAATARFVAARCGDRPVLELGVGTGRLAGPLAGLGVTVVGVDASAAMLARCAARGLGDRVRLVRADMAALPLAGRFGAVLVAFNTLFNLPTGAAQRRLFAEATALIGGDGCLVIESLDAAVLAGAGGRAIGPGGGSGGGRGVTVVATDVDPVAQTIDGRHLEIDDDGVRIRPWFLRWATLTQLDGYATAAGLVPVERYRSWDGEPHRPGDDVQISVYRAASRTLADHGEDRGQRGHRPDG